MFSRRTHVMYMNIRQRNCNIFKHTRVRNLYVLPHSTTGLVASPRTLKAFCPIKACTNKWEYQIFELTWPATTRSTLTHVPWPHSACDEAPVQSSCRSVHRTPCQSAVHAHLSRQVTHTNRHVFLCLPRVRRSCRFTVVYATRTCSALCFSIRTDNKRTQCVNRT